MIVAFPHWKAFHYPKQLSLWYPFNKFKLFFHLHRRLRHNSLHATQCQHYEPIGHQLGVTLSWSSSKTFYLEKTLYRLLVTVQKWRHAYRGRGGGECDSLGEGVTSCTFECIIITSLIKNDLYNFPKVHCNVMQFWWWHGSCVLGNQYIALIILFTVLLLCNTQFHSPVDRNARRHLCPLWGAPHRYF